MYHVYGYKDNKNNPVTAMSAPYFFILYSEPYGITIINFHAVDLPILEFSRHTDKTLNNFNT